MPGQNIRWELLQKEMDIIERSIKNLDEIIYKMKNFAFLAWGGSIYLIAQHLGNFKEQRFWLYLLTSCIPVLFWIMNAIWNKHLLKCGMRKGIISSFVNHADFEYFICKENEWPLNEKFPFYDSIGNIFNRKEPIDPQFASRYIVDESKLTWLRIANYKDTAVFYGTMLLLSVVFSLFFRCW